MRWIAAVLLLAPAFAGCTTDTTYRLDGAFTEERTQDDIDEAQRLVEEHGGTMALQESFPEQFIASGLGQSACEDLKAVLDPKPYLQFVGTCQAESVGGGGGY